MEIIACLKTNKYLLISSDVIFIKEKGSWKQVTDPQQMTKISLKVLKEIRIDFGNYKNIPDFIKDKTHKNCKKESKEFTPQPGESRYSIMGGGS